MTVDQGALEKTLPAPVPNRAAPDAGRGKGEIGEGGERKGAGMREMGVDGGRKGVGG